MGRSNSIHLDASFAELWIPRLVRGQNVKLYTEAVEKLDFKFEGKPYNVMLLVQALQNRAY